MKISGAVALLAFSVSVANGFVAMMPRPAFTSTQLYNTETEAELEAQAIAATKEFGATSKEARVLWDAVEEMRAADSHVNQPMGGLDTECAISEEGDADPACQEYESKMAALKEMLAGYNEKLTEMKTLAKDLKDIKLSVNSRKIVETNPEIKIKMKEAVEAAKKATAEFGVDSSEAKLAWETVEDIAASGLSNAMGKGLDEECLVEQAQDACIALEELNKALGISS